jgi:hypothetical protein
MPQASNDQLGTCSLGVADSGLELRSGVSLAALHFHVLRDQLPAATSPGDKPLSSRADRSQMVDLLVPLTSRQESHHR